MKEISENEFTASPAELLFKDDDIFNRKFSLLQGTNYKLAWQSDLLSPAITEIKPFIFAIGIDQNFAIVDTSNSTIPLKLTLDDFFCTTKIFGGVLFVASQLQLIKIDLQTYSITKKYDLPEFYDSMNVKGIGYEVHFMENTVLDIV